MREPLLRRGIHRFQRLVNGRDLALPRSLQLRPTAVFVGGPLRHCGSVGFRKLALARLSRGLNGLQSCGAFCSYASGFFVVERFVLRLGSRCMGFEFGFRHCLELRFNRISATPLLGNFRVRLLVFLLDVCPYFLVIGFSGLLKKCFQQTDFSKRVGRTFRRWSGLVPALAVEHEKHHCQHYTNPGGYTVGHRKKNGTHQNQKQKQHRERRVAKHQW